MRQIFYLVFPLALLSMIAQAEGVIPPYYVEYEMPKYPNDLKPLEKDGRMVTELTVSISGSVISARVLESTLPEGFNRVVTEALEKAKFKPRCKQGFKKAFVVKNAIELRRPASDGENSDFQIEKNIYGATETLEPERTPDGVRLKRVDLCAGR